MLFELAAPDPKILALPLEAWGTSPPLPSTVEFNPVPPVLGAPNMKIPPELGSAAAALPLVPPLLPLLVPPEAPKMLFAEPLLLLLLGTTSKMLAAGFASKPPDVAGSAAPKRPPHPTVQFKKLSQPPPPRKLAYIYCRKHCSANTQQVSDVS